MEWVSSLSLEDHDSQEISHEKVSDELYHSLPDWLTEICLTDTEDMDISVALMDFDQKFSNECQIDQPQAILPSSNRINEKPRPDFDRLLKKPNKKKNRKQEWPKVITDNWENQYKYIDSIKPSGQSSPKTSPVAQHRKKLSPKRFNFDI